MHTICKFFFFATSNRYGLFFDCKRQSKSRIMDSGLSGQHQPWKQTPCARCSRGLQAPGSCSRSRKRLLSASLARPPQLTSSPPALRANYSARWPWKIPLWYLKGFISAPLSRQNDEYCQASASARGQIQTNRKGHFQHLLWQEIHYSAQSSQSYTLREKLQLLLTLALCFLEREKSASSLIRHVYGLKGIVHNAAEKQITIQHLSCLTVNGVGLHA